MEMLEVLWPHEESEVRIRVLASCPHEMELLVCSRLVLLVVEDIWRTVAEVWVCQEETSLGFWPLSWLTEVWVMLLEARLYVRVF